MSNLCEKCNQPNRDIGKYCKYCGAKLEIEGISLESIVGLEGVKREVQAIIYLLLLIIFSCFGCSAPDPVEEESFEDAIKTLIDTGLVTTKFYNRNDEIVCMGLLINDGNVVSSAVSAFQPDDILRFNSLIEYVQVEENPSELQLAENCLFVMRGYADTEPEIIPARSKVYLVTVK